MTSQIRDSGWRYCAPFFPFPDTLLSSRFTLVLTWKFTFVISLHLSNGWLGATVTTQILKNKKLFYVIFLTAVFSSVQWTGHVTFLWFMWHSSTFSIFRESQLLVYNLQDFNFFFRLAPMHLWLTSLMPDNYLWENKNKIKTTGKRFW